jgi:hypothetical protein
MLTTSFAGGIRFWADGPKANTATTKSALRWGWLIHSGTCGLCDTRLLCAIVADCSRAL